MDFFGGNKKCEISVCCACAGRPNVTHALGTPFPSVRPMQKAISRDLMLLFGKQARVASTAVVHQCGAAIRLTSCASSDV